MSKQSRVDHAESVVPLQGSLPSLDAGGASDIDQALPNFLQPGSKEAEYQKLLSFIDKFDNYQGADIRAVQEFDISYARALTVACYHLHKHGTQAIQQRDNGVVDRSSRTVLEFLDGRGLHDAFNYYSVRAREESINSGITTGAELDRVAAGHEGGMGEFNSSMSALLTSVWSNFSLRRNLEKLPHQRAPNSPFERLDTHSRFRTLEVFHVTHPEAERLQYFGELIEMGASLRGLDDLTCLTMAERYMQGAISAGYNYGFLTPALAVQASNLSVNGFQVDFLRDAWDECVKLYDKTRGTPAKS